MTFNALLTTFVFEVRDCSPYKQESLQSYAIIEYIYIPTSTHKGSDEGIVTNELLKYVFLFWCLVPMCYIYLMLLFSHCISYLMDVLY